MGDRHGGRFARRGRALSPPRRGFPMARCGVPMARGGGQDLPRAETLPSANASRNGARAKGFAPRENALLGESLPTRRTSEKICPRENTPLGEGLPKRRTSERICPRENAPSAKASRHGAQAKRFTRAGTRPSAKASRHGARAKRFAPRGSRSPHVLTNGGPPPTDEQPEKPPFGGVAPETARPLPSSFTLKKRLLHEIQLFYGESHVGSRQIFPSFPSVDRCVARERNPVPPFAPHRGRGHRSLRRDGEMCHGFGEMVRRFGECPHGGESLPRGGNGWLRGDGRYYPGLRCFGERFHRRCRANPDAFRSSRPTFRNRRRSGEKTFGGRRCSRG